MSARLYPDMLPLTRQVQIATDIARRRGAPCRRRATVYEDNEKTFDDLTARIQRTLDYIGPIPGVRGFGDAGDHAARCGRPHTFTGANYLRVAVPNVYFHAATTYGILRHNGVPLGKADFLGTLD
jgi:hypothetical protein